MGTNDRRQRPLFDEPARDPIWSDPQLKRMAEEGFYWTPEGRQNGPYVRPETTPEEPREPGRARLRSSGSRKPAQP